MFYYFNGEVTLLESNLAVIDCGGVGYACRTSSYTLSRLHVGERARLYTYCSIREDAFDIYGFSTREDSTTSGATPSTGRTGRWTSTSGRCGTS